MRKAAILGIFAFAASAQHADWYWQVSSDAGASWQGGIVEVPLSQTSLLVRLQCSWTDIPGGYAFAGSQFDALVTGIDGAGAGDVAQNLQRPGPFAAGSRQTLVATRFANIIKLDDIRDTAGPGLGTRGVFPGQLVENFSGGNFTTANPATIFEYELLLDGSLGDRLLSEIGIAPTDLGLSVRIYTTPTGGQYVLQNNPTGGPISQINATIRVVPAPNGPGLLCVATLLIARRRRRRR